MSLIRMLLGLSPKTTQFWHSPVRLSFASILRFILWAGLMMPIGLRKTGLRGTCSYYAILKPSGSIVGWVYAYMNLRQRYAIFGMVVSEQFQREGIGWALITLLISQLKRIGIHKIYGTTHIDNANAIRLYKRAGFKVLGLSPEPDTVRSVPELLICYES